LARDAEVRAAAFSNLATETLQPSQRSEECSDGASLCVQTHLPCETSVLRLGYRNSPNFRRERKMEMEKIVMWAGFPLLLALSCLAIACSGESGNGKQMYLQYCSSCHGRTGMGDGPVSEDLKAKIPDLTILAQKNRGIYPLDDVMATIDGRRLVRAHGDREMPVWGEIFHSDMSEKKYTELTTLLKAKIIAEYIGTLQK